MSLIACEPLGIVTALLNAGASSVCGALWPIASGSGRTFSKFFCEAFRAADTGVDTIDLAVAMQSTVKRMRRDEEMEMPYNWAGFVLHGSPYIWRIPNDGAQ